MPGDRDAGGHQRLDLFGRESSARPGSRGCALRHEGPGSAGWGGSPSKSAGVASMGMLLCSSGTSTTDLAARNCPSAMTSSIVLTGLQKSSGSASKASAHSSSGRVAKISSSRPISSRALMARSGAGGEALVGEPLGPPDGAGQGGPVAVALEADDPKGSTVARRVVVHDGAVHRLAHPDVAATDPT